MAQISKENKIFSLELLPSPSLPDPTRLLSAVGILPGIFSPNRDNFYQKFLKVKQLKLEMQML
jgi:hypothetical protein